MVGALLSRPEDSGDGDPAVQTRSLSRRFAAIDAVSDLTLRVERGQIFGFLGPNGAGKTTTIKMLCGLLEPTSGSARVAGCDIRTERATRHETDHTISNNIAALYEARAK